MKSNTRNQMLCLWCGPLAILLWLIGFWAFAGFLAPQDPEKSAAEIAADFDDKRDAIRFGLFLTMLGATFTGPWVAAISVQLKRIEGRYSPMAYTQLGLGMGGILLFIIPVMNLQTAAYREDRPDELVHLASDLGWMPFVGVWTMAFVQNLAIGIAILQDKDQTLPRWVGYFNIWTALLYPPGSAIYYFKDGPFAWNGAFAWWLVVCVFCLWFAVMFVVLRKAIQQQAALDDPEPADTEPTVDELHH